MRFDVKEGILKPSLLGAYRLDEISPIPLPPLQTSFPYLKELQQLLQGKKLLLDEIPLPLSTIQEHYENGYIMYHDGVTNQQGRYQCERCGNQAQHLFHSYDCQRCKQKCCYCRHCIMMGRVSQCTPLLTWTGPLLSFVYEEPINWEGSLSPPQQQASQFLVQSVRRNRSALIWAVCGAGKTEMLFEGIHVALSSGKRVCVATPRTDVVLELSPRFQKVFPHTPIATLYGGTEDRHVYAPFVIATTHQLFRFSEAFDVIIVDEVDAFPYAFDETLQSAVQRASKKKGTQIFLTATPSKVWQKEAKCGKRAAVIIPARYHGYSLPVPRFSWCPLSQKSLRKGKLPKKIYQWMQQHLYQRPILLFVPHIDSLLLVTKILKEIDTKVEGVYSEDETRQEKVQEFRKGDIPLLVTTTILERGITIENVQVAVFMAEDKVFTESALVQIAGRVGRSNQYPYGDVIFFHGGKSNAMVAAKRQIEEMNKEACQKGLIKG